jgi:hypothetical protein
MKFWWKLKIFGGNYLGGNYFFGGNYFLVEKFEV